MNKLAAVAQLSVCFVLLLCISGSAQNKPAELVGSWICEYTKCRSYGSLDWQMGTPKYECKNKIDTLELFKDGMAIWNGDPGKWEVLDDHRIRVNAGMGGAFASNYKISGYELTLTDITDDAEKAKVFIRKENFEELKAKQAAERAAENAKYEAFRPVYDAANSAYNNKDYDRAITEYTKAINLYPDYADVFNDRGDAYFMKKDYDNAIADYTKSIELAPKERSYYTERCLAYGHKGEYDKAIEDCNKAIELGLGFGWSYKLANEYNNRGFAYTGKKDYDKAISDYTEVLRLNPKNANAYDRRAFAYVGKKDYDKAISDYTKALELDPKMEDSYLERGKAYNAKSEYKKAADDFVKFLQMSEDSEKIKEAKAGIERVQKAAPNIGISVAIRNVDLVDNRDKKVYKTNAVANKTWMGENLNYNITGSVCKDDKAENCEKYGRLYTWDAAMKACPAGTHLPSDEEWKTFESYFNDGKKYSGLDSRSKLNIGKQIEANKDKFLIQRGGSKIRGNKIISGDEARVHDFWWSSTEGNQKGNAKNAWYRGIGSGSSCDGQGYNCVEFIYWSSGKAEKEMMGSVRCIKD